MLTWFKWGTLMTALGSASYYGYRATPWSCMDVTVTAYWVQAVGSIAAILGAFFVMGRQNKAAIRLVADTDLRTMRRRAQSVSAVVHKADNQFFACVSEIQKMAVEGNPQKINKSWAGTSKTLQQTRAALEQIPPHELGSYAMVEGIYETIGALTVFENAAETWLGYTDVNRPAQQILDAIPTLVRMMIGARATFKRGMEDLATTDR